MKPCQDLLFFSACAALCWTRVLSDCIKYGETGQSTLKRLTEKVLSDFSTPSIKQCFDSCKAQPACVGQNVIKQADGTLRCQLITLSNVVLSAQQSYFQDLTSGYTTNNAQRGISACLSTPCSNNGVCLDRGGYYICNCQPANYGTHCEFTECSPPQNTSHSFVVNINVSPLLITATYECSPGYWYSNGVFTTTSQCFANGTWSSVPDCADTVDCGNVPPLTTDSQLVLVNVPTSTVYLATATYQCAPGQWNALTYQTSTCQANGKWSAVTACIDPCTSHVVLNDATRSIDYHISSSGSAACDISLTSAWYRLQLYGQDALMPTACPSVNTSTPLICGTSAPGWYNGSAPSVGQIAQGKLCAAWSGQCCNAQWSGRTIVTKNCSAFMVYYLTPVPRCDVRYCAELDPCTNYTVLNDTWRSVDYKTDNLAHCDITLQPRWYQIQVNELVTTLPTVCPATGTCGTSYPLWFQAPLIQPGPGEIVQGAACASYTSNCCYSSLSLPNIQMKNCGSYNVYNLKTAVACNTAYCAQNDACQNYQILNDSWRGTTYYYDGQNRCDSSLQEGWYRLQIAGVDTQIPTSCPSSQACGTTAPAWFSGSMPTALGQVTQGSLCVYNATLSSPCCDSSYGSPKVDVKNCGTYNVYYLKPITKCPAAYCAVMNTSVFYIGTSAALLPASTNLILDQPYINFYGPYDETNDILTSVSQKGVYWLQLAVGVPANSTTDTRLQGLPNPVVVYTSSSVFPNDVMVTDTIQTLDPSMQLSLSTQTTVFGFNHNSYTSTSLLGFRLDSTMATDVYFSLYVTNTVDVAAGVPIPFDTVLTNVGASWSTVSNKFTAPAAGAYFFSMATLSTPMDLTDSAGNIQFEVSMTVGGFINGGQQASRGAILLQLTANQQMTFTVRNGGTTPITMPGSTDGLVNAQGFFYSPVTSVTPMAWSLCKSQGGSNLRFTGTSGPLSYEKTIYWTGVTVSGNNKITIPTSGGAGTYLVDISAYVCGANYCAASGVTADSNSVMTIMVNNVATVTLSMKPLSPSINQCLTRSRSSLVKLNAGDIVQVNVASLGCYWNGKSTVYGTTNTFTGMRLY